MRAIHKCKVRACAVLRFSEARASGVGAAARSRAAGQAKGLAAALCAKAGAHSSDRQALLKVQELEVYYQAEIWTLVLRRATDDAPEC